MAITSAFQADDAGSIPAVRSKLSYTYLISAGSNTVERFLPDCFEK